MIERFCSTALELRPVRDFVSELHIRQENDPGWRRRALVHSCFASCLAYSCISAVVSYVGRGERRHERAATPP